MFASLGQKPRKIAVLDPLPPFPWALDYMWDWFREFALGLKANGMAPVMAGWDDVQHWSAAMQLDVEPWEKLLLVRLANLRASIQSEHDAAKNKEKRR